MNYIKHLNAVFKRFSKDSSLNATHISVYMALFQSWNIHRFKELFYIHRDEIMEMAKIGSNPTYHRCLRKLHDQKYIQYLPSHNPYKGSRVRMFIFDASSKQVVGKHETSSEQVLTPSINLNKQNKNLNKLELPQSENEVLIFFKNKNWPELEGRKFYNHYTSIGWSVRGNIKITNWHATAESWMLKANDFRSQSSVFQNRDNLKTTKYKNYGEPL
ncbi:hypothetical protein [Gramella sp. AN32]|uniref:Transcriptional regulator n=3 Tax=Christiangramia TaxID=292691 RepID=A0ABW5X8P9_9FLAO|nr:hypothetical protein [Gramella sp. AN32]MCM4156146.1 hypothetical protein [Gramella sp. AN32]